LYVCGPRLIHPRAFVPTEMDPEYLTKLYTIRPILQYKSLFSFSVAKFGTTLRAGLYLYARWQCESKEPYGRRIWGDRGAQESPKGAVRLLDQCSSVA
jgi:hypothetical protein